MVCTTNLEEGHFGRSFGRGLKQGIPHRFTCLASRNQEREKADGTRERLDSIPSGLTAVWRGLNRRVHIYTVDGSSVYTRYSCNQGGIDCQSCSRATSMVSGPHDGVPEEPTLELGAVGGDARSNQLRCALGRARAQLAAHRR